MTSRSLARAEVSSTNGDASRAAPRWVAHPALSGAGLVLVATLAGSLTMAAHTKVGVTWLDGAARSVVSMHSANALNEAMTALTSFGGEVTLLLIFVALARWAYAARGVWWSRFFGVVMTGALAFDNVIKPLVGRPRPTFDQLVAGQGPSWPSGHTTGTTALLFAVAFYVSSGRGRGPRVALGAVALVGSILMGATRIYLGVHWPTDVIAGIVLGTTWAATCARFLRIDEMPRRVSQSITTRRTQLAFTFTLALVGLAFTPF